MALLLQTFVENVCVMRDHTDFIAIKRERLLPFVTKVQSQFSRLLNHYFKVLLGLHVEWLSVFEVVDHKVLIQALGEYLFDARS